ncbi:uncharacterized protein LOC135476493 [Liolophura sinensis]|uniref:uncharacterized protein LOC135476493 n=1 Tax=Liolophura sinensis TaxID=3198878 RepID=UPI0031593FED
MGSKVSSRRNSQSSEGRKKRRESHGRDSLTPMDESGAHGRYSSAPSSRSTSQPASRDVTPKGSPRPRTAKRVLEEGNQSQSRPELDLMISYSHSDKVMMNKLKDALERNGLKVWVDVVGLGVGVDFLSKIGQAIIDSKLFLSLLSEKSVESKYCQDELALAYISNKPIIPVGLADRKTLISLMDTGMRLQLAGFRWNMFLDEAEFDEDFKRLLGVIQDALEKLNTEEETEKAERETKEKDQADKEKPPLKRQTTRYQFYTKSNALAERVELTQSQEQMPDKFWQQHFGQKQNVDYNEFVDRVREEYRAELDEMYSESDQLWLMNLVRREMEVEEDNLLLKDYFISFCTVDGMLCPLWVRLEDQARESYAMREVFDMESSVRVEAIENLSKFKSLAVIDALKDLLDDHEPNVRTVAAVSLAKTGAQDKQTLKKLMKTLNDKDRLVREAGCIALGRLKAEHAVPRLVHIWRNDVISSVRDAAGLALEQIGGPQAEKAMQITKILAEEIRMLAQSS